MDTKWIDRDKTNEFEKHVRYGLLDVSWGFFANFSKIAKPLYDPLNWDQKAHIYEEK